MPAEPSSPSPAPAASSVGEIRSSASGAEHGPSTCFVHGGPWYSRPTAASAGAWLIIALFFAIPLRGLLHLGGSMDEGIVLVFPERILKGDLPNRDFLHLYGPGSLYTLAGWFQLFGVSLRAERIFGLLQHVFIVGAIFTLVRPFGRIVATYSAVIVMLLVLIPTGPSALAWLGGLAFGLWSLTFGVRALHLAGNARARSLVAAGVLAGLALSFRPDLLLALGLAWGFLYWKLRWSPHHLLGVVVGLTPMWVHLALVGLPTAWHGMFTDPVVALRPARNLPRPPSWSFIDGALQPLTEIPFPTPWWPLPAMAASHQLFVWFFVVLIVNLGVPLLLWRWLRRRGHDQRLVTALVLAIFGLGLTAQTLQRPDSTHLAWGWVASAALLPVVIAIALERRSGRFRWLQRAAPLGAVMALMLAVCPFWTFRSYVVMARVSIGSLPMGYEITRGDRNFYLNEDLQAAAMQGAVDRMAALSQPGERLFVGTADLRRTNYNEPFIYHLFPELTPATYYIELEPGISNKPGSRLAGEIESADWLVLTNFWTGWYEPNTSADYGSNVPNEVVASSFCLVESFADALVLLYQNCAQGDGVEPWTLGIGPKRIADMEKQKAKREGNG